MSRMSRPAHVRDMGPAAYHAWLAESVADFGDYHFSRQELDDIGVGLHTKAARSLANVARRHRWSLGDLVRVGANSLHQEAGIGVTALIVAACLLHATYPSFNFEAWIGGASRTIRGGVVTVAAKKKRR